MWHVAVRGGWCSFRALRTGQHWIVMHKHVASQKLWNHYHCDHGRLLWQHYHWCNKLNFEPIDLGFCTPPVQCGQVAWASKLFKEGSSSKWIATNIVVGVEFDMMFMSPRLILDICCVPTVVWQLQSSLPETVKLQPKNIALGMLAGVVGCITVCNMVWCGLDDQAHVPGYTLSWMTHAHIIHWTILRSA